MHVCSQPLVSAVNAGVFVTRCLGTSDGTLATVPSEVYMLGGLLYELLTAGHEPYHWLLDDADLFLARLRSAAVVPIPGAPGHGFPGLQGRNTLAAAAIDGVPVPWTVAAGSPGPGESADLLEEAKGLVEACLQQDPAARPTLDRLWDAVVSLHCRLACA